MIGPKVTTEANIWSGARAPSDSLDFGDEISPSFSQAGAFGRDVERVEELFHVVLRRVAVEQSFKSAAAPTRSGAPRDLRPTQIEE